MKKLFKMVVNVEKLLKNGENGDFLKICQKMVKCSKMLVKTLKKFFAVIFYYTMDIKDTIFNPKFYQHFLPSLLITLISIEIPASLVGAWGKEISLFGWTIFNLSLLIASGLP